MATAIKPKAQPSLVVSFGAESYFLDRDLERARSWEGRQVVLLDGDGLTDIELVSACEAPSFDNRDRVVVVDDAQKMKGDKALRAYVEDKSPTDDSTVLVAAVRAEKLPEIWKFVASKGKLYEHKKLKTYEDNNDVVRWLETEVKKSDRRFDTGAAAKLYWCIGNDLHRLSNEMRKLCLIVPRGEKITMEQVAIVATVSPTATTFQVADAMIQRNSKAAMDALTLLYRTQGEECNIPLVAALMKTVERTMIARKLIDQGADDDVIASALGMHPFLCKKFLLHVRKHPIGLLVRHMSRLCKLDAEVKGAARSKRTLVELTVLSIAG